MAVSDHWHRVAKFRSTVVEVDPSNNVIDVRVGDGAPRRIMVWEVPSGFRWPVVGEEWSIYEQNGSWYLGDRINDLLDDHPITNMQPGDQRLDGNRVFNTKGDRLLSADVTSAIDGTPFVYDANDEKLIAGSFPLTLPPNGPAGGSLTGIYPNPTIAAAAVTSAMLVAEPYCDITRVITAQSILNITATALIFDTSIDNGFGMWNGGAPTIITVPKAGRYMVEANCQWAVNGTGDRELFIAFSNSTNALPRNSGTMTPGSAVNFVNQSVCTPVFLPAGGTISAQVYQNSGGALNAGGPPSSFFGLSTNLRVSWLGR